MFESIEDTQPIDKQDYETRLPSLRVDLINAQYDLSQADFPLLIVIAGNDRVGCNDVVQTLHEWMDARYIETEFFGQLTKAERERPRFWRYWRALPPKGRTAIFFGAWPLNLMADRLTRRIGHHAFAARLDFARAFERTLTDDGVVLLKFWLHLPKKKLHKRLRQARKHPDKRWRVEDRDWTPYELYDESLPVVEEVIRGTDDEHAPWRLIDSSDARTRNLAIAESIRGALHERLADSPDPATTPAPVPLREATEVADALGAVPLTRSLPYDKYRRLLEKWQRRLARRTRRARREGLSTVLVFEGWDAAGKGGVIRRITNAMAVRDYRVVPIAAPTAEEKRYHYLWRFWRELPPAGRMVIFDRSWYGRVLVERIEGFASPEAWRRAYAEIRDFERQLADHGIVLAKFWLHIDPEEQLRRFKAREQTPYKKYKITDEDYRNRAKWDQYAVAVNDMVAETDKPHAPWRIVAANDKRWARVEVLKTVCKRLDRALDAL